MRQMQEFPPMRPKPWSKVRMPCDQLPLSNPASSSPKISTRQKLAHVRFAGFLEQILCDATRVPVEDHFMKQDVEIGRLKADLHQIKPSADMH